jgi:hypothetical protein
LEELRAVVTHRALAAWDRSTETFGEEVVALNDIDEALGNLCLQVLNWLGQPVEIQTGTIQDGEQRVKFE